MRGLILVLENTQKVKRLQCMKCYKYFDFYSKSYHRDSVCPFCGGYFIGFRMGQEKGFIMEVPWWYGKPIPGWLDVEWGHNHGYDDCALIPEFYLDVNIYIAGENGEQKNREQALRYFTDYTKEHWDGIPIKVIGNLEWEKIRQKSLHIF